MTEVIEFTSIIKTSSKDSKTTRIKVVDNFYPLIGEAKVAPTDSLRVLKNKRNTIIPDSQIYQQNTPK